MLKTQNPGLGGKKFFIEIFQKQFLRTHPGRIFASKRKLPIVHCGFYAPEVTNLNAVAK